MNRRSRVDDGHRPGWVSDPSPKPPSPADAQHELFAELVEAEDPS